MARPTNLIQPTRDKLDRALSCPTTLKTDDGREISIQCWEPSFDARNPWSVAVRLTGIVRVHDALVSRSDPTEVEEA